jgi:hypothetical protein
MLASSIPHIHDFLEDRVEQLAPRQQDLVKKALERSAVYAVVPEVFDSRSQSESVATTIECTRDS